MKANSMHSVTINTLHAKKQAGEKFTCIAAYDATFARAISEAGVDIILVGDSLGMVLQGHDSTLPVTVEDMIYHTASVKRGNQGALIIGDMPFMAYEDASSAMRNAAKLMQAGAHMVKMEGGRWLSSTISKLVERGIPVCGHLGLTPQSVNTLGGFRVQGRQPEQAKQILDEALALQEAGAQLLVLECVPRDLGANVSKNLHIPVIGIGAGPETDAQVLVLHDMLGLNPRPPRFVRNFMSGGNTINEALSSFVDEVTHQRFPAAEHCF
jgi:3-methyl-2-oxobutanoate hydroxymethyltransferase